MENTINKIQVKGVEYILTDELAHSEIQNLKENTYLKDEVNNLIDNKVGEIDLTPYETVEGASEKYQEKGDYIKYEDTATNSNPNRKSVVLDNHNNILGKDTNGGAYNIAMVSKWNVVDMGTVSLPINLNGSTPRPTYNDDKEIALLEDIKDKYYTKEEIDEIVRTLISVKDGSIIVNK